MFKIIYAIGLVICFGFTLSYMQSKDIQSQIFFSMLTICNMIALAGEHVIDTLKPKKE